MRAVRLQAHVALEGGCGVQGERVVVDTEEDARERAYTHSRRHSDAVCACVRNVGLILHTSIPAHVNMLVAQM